jgi:hypothetical protein
MSVLTLSISALIFVELALILCWFKWQFIVSDDLDRYLCTAHSVNQGHDVKSPFLIAAIHLVLTGLKHAA